MKDKKEMYRIETENADGERGELLVSPEHRVYVGERGSTVNLSLYNIINLPSKSSGLDFSLSNEEKALINDSILRCGVFNQTIENIVSLLYKNLFLKSESLVTNTLCSDLENSDNLPFESSFGFEITSTPCCLRNISSLLSTFSSKRNLSLEGGVNNDILFTSSELSCILQGCFNMLFSQRRECFKNFFDSSSVFEHLQDLPDHDSCAFESGFTMTDFAVCNNILVNFNSHCNDNSNNDYLSFSISKNLSNFNLIKISDIYDNLENNNLKDKQLVFLDEQCRENLKEMEMKQKARISLGRAKEFVFETSETLNFCFVSECARELEIILDMKKLFWEK